MRIGPSIMLCAAMLVSVPGVAATACAVSSVNLVFGAYNEFQMGPTDSTGHVGVTCFGMAGELAAYTITLSTGSGTHASRRMQASNGAQLHYNLYSSPARLLVWGDGGSGSVTVSDSFQLRAGALTRSYPVYGRIFALQKVPVGVYTDPSS